MTSACLRLEIRLRYKLIEPSGDVEECIVDENQSDGNKKRARGELDHPQRTLDSPQEGQNDADCQGGCQKRERQPKAVEREQQRRRGAVLLRRNRQNPR